MLITNAKELINAISMLCEACDISPENVSLSISCSLEQSFFVRMVSYPGDKKVHQQIEICTSDPEG